MGEWSARRVSHSLLFEPVELIGLWTQTCRLSGVDGSESQYLVAASRTAKGVDKSERVRGSLKALAQGAQRPTHEADNCQPSETWHGWQHEASRVERHFRSHQMGRIAGHAGPVAGPRFRQPQRPSPVHGGLVAPSPSSLPLRASLTLWPSSRLGHHRVASVGSGCWVDWNLQSRVVAPGRAAKEVPTRPRTSCFGPRKADCNRRVENGDHRRRSPFVRKCASRHGRHLGLPIVLRCCERGLFSQAAKA